VIPVKPIKFVDRLTSAWSHSGSLVCVGLDPDREKIPRRFHGEAHPFFEFNRLVVDATHDLVCAYKPQIAFYSAAGAERDLELTIGYIRERAPQAVILLDAKRNDIGNTATAYAKEAFDRYGAHAVTVNPYMGDDSVLPFLARPEYGAAVLCRTSNPGARDFQDLSVGGLPLYRRVARHASERWNAHRNLMLVVGATYIEEMAALRREHPQIPFLVPGIGHQGGDLEATLRAGLNTTGDGLLVASSRAIIYAGDGSSAAVRAAALELKTLINQIRGLP
jgi:orotidine-5'-phosphate decarboxylase